MQFSKNGTRARIIRLAVLIAFFTQGVALFTLLPDARSLLPKLQITAPETASIASLGLTCLAAAYLALKIFIRRRLKFEEKLLRSEAFARTTLDALPAHLAIVDRWGAIIS